MATDVPDILLKKRVLTLDLSSVVAGTKYRGEFEERIKNIVMEIKKANNIIIFIDELHTISELAVRKVLWMPPIC